MKPARRAIYALSLLLTAPTSACDADGPGGPDTGGVADVDSPSDSTAPAEDTGNGSTTPATYEQIEELVKSFQCASASVCHNSQGQGRAAGLNFETATDVRALLVDTMSCQNPAMPLVDPGHPENSWLMFKLDGPHDASGNLVAQPGWTASGTGGACADFGRLMPEGVTTPSIETAQLVRSWIEAGAPGP